MKNTSINKNKLSLETIDFFDKLAKYMSNDNYSLGKSDKKIDVNSKIGRYGFSYQTLYSYDIGINLNYLIYTNEGHMKQDEIIFNIFKDLFKNNKEMILLNNNKLIFFDSLEKSVKLTISNILVYVYIYGFQRFKSFLENIDRTEDEYTLLLEFQNCNISQVTGYELKNKEIVINDSILKKSKNEKVENNLENELLKVLKELIEKSPESIKKLSYKENSKINNIEEVITKSKKNEKSEFSINDILKNKEFKEFIQNLKDELISIFKGNDKIDKSTLLNGLTKEKDKLVNTQNTLKKISKNYDNKKNNYLDDIQESSAIVEKNDEIMEKIEYTDSAKYIEKTTGKKIEKNRDSINNITKKYNEDSKTKSNKYGNIKGQNDFETFREKKSNKIDILDIVIYILNNPTATKNSLETLENSLSNLNVKYTNISSYENIKKKIVFNVFNNVYKYADKKMKEYFNVETNISNDYTDNFKKYKDIDDIELELDKNLNENNYMQSKSYRILDKLKRDNLLKESYRTVNGQRVYKRARRLLDNILINFINSITETKYFDGIEEKYFNILRNTFIYIDELEMGIKNNEYIELFKLKQLNLTKYIIHLIFEKTNFPKKSLLHICRQIVDTRQLSFEEYLRNNTYSEDKKIIKSKFKTSKILKEFCRENELMVLYTFYNSIYENNNIKNNSSQESYIVNGDSIKCSMATSSSKLIATKSNEYINGKKKALVNDTTILPFSYCNACKVCNPTIVGQWTSNNNSNNNGNKYITSKSKAICKFGGVITVSENNNMNKIIKMNREKEEKNNLKITDITTQNEIRCKWIDFAYEEYMKYKGMKENSRLLARNGDKSLREKIKEYHLKGGGIFGTYKISWCMSFVNYIMLNSIKIDLKTPSTDTFSRIYTKHYKKIRKLYYGAIAYFRQYDEKGNYLGKGHICFVLYETDDKKYLICLGGNQNNEIKISKYKKDRQYVKKGVYMKLEGIYWPKQVEITDKYKIKDTDNLFVENGVENV